MFGQFAIWEGGERAHIRRVEYEHVQSRACRLVWRFAGYHVLTQLHPFVAARMEQLEATGKFTFFGWIERHKVDDPFLPLRD